MSLENFETIPETVSETQEESKLGSFLNPNYLSGEPYAVDGIFVDTSEGLTAADFVAAGVGEFVKPGNLDSGETFLNPNYLEGATPVSGDTFLNPSYISGDTVVVPDVLPGGEYVGPSLEQLEYEIQEATDDLTKAELRLQEAMESGGSVLTLMSTVESCRNILETRMRMYNEALVSATAAPLGTKEGASTDEVKFGSVSHKQWELEQAIKSGNSIAIEHKQRDLAHEIAKEEAKKLQKK